MKLTPENLDDMDCRPGPGDGSIAVSERIERLIAERQAQRAERERAAAPETPASPE
jgi:hypothetical protein